MKRTIVLALAFILVILSAGDSLAATKKKTVVQKKRIVRRVRYRTPASYPLGSRPTFPVYAAKESGEKTLSIKIVNTAVVTPEATIQNSGLAVFGEIGLGGGAISAELGLHKHLSDSLVYYGGFAYGFGADFGVGIFDLARIGLIRGDWMLGGGVCYASYSNKPSFLPDRNLLGLELWVARSFDRWTGRAAYNSAMGLRIAAGAEL
jgi:hypothetical protein